MLRPNSRHERQLFWQIIIGAVFTLAFILVGMSSCAQAQHVGHPPQDMELHRKFYSTWMMPDNRRVSCCHDEDCSPAQAKKVNGTWFARKTDNDEWVQIPQNKVDIGLADSPDVPDARALLCGRKFAGGFGADVFTVFCFTAGQGG
jgi:hypothetical protein